MRLLLILILIPFISKSQISNFGSSLDCTPATSETPSGSTWSRNTTYVMFVKNAKSTSPPDIPVVTSPTLVWKQVGTVLLHTTGTPMIRLTAFIMYSPTTVSEDYTINYTNTQGCRARWTFQILGHQDLVLSTASDAQDGTADPTLTLSIPGSFNVIFGAANNREPFGGVPESGWTETYDAGHGGGNPNGVYGMYRVATSDNTPTVTSASANWGAIALVFRERRLMSIR